MGRAGVWIYSEALEVGTWAKLGAGWDSRNDQELYSKKHKVATS